MVEGKVGPSRLRVDISRVDRSINSIEVDIKGPYRLKLEFSKGILNFNII